MLSSYMVPPPPLLSSSTNATGTVFPVEVLTEILLLACGKFRIKPAAFNTRRTRLCMVSKYWRDLIRLDPRFWVGLHVCAHTRSSHIEMVRTRSQNMPIDLVLDTHLTGIPTRMFNSTFDRLLSEIVVIMDRCIAISVINHIPRVADGVLAWLRSTDAPNVKRLDLVLSPGFRRHPTASPLAIVLPHSTITKFVLKHGFVIFDPPSFYSALTHLHIGPVRNEVYFAGLYWRLLRETLQACVVLTHLVLDRVECVDMPPISLPPYSRCAVPTLRYLCIRCEANSTGQILLLLDLPDLSAFRFVGFGPYVEFISVTTVSFYLSVRHLELDTHIISPFMLVTILELFPLLRTLNIQNSSQATVDSLIRSARIADPPLCQFLQEIHVGGVLGIAQVKRILLNRAEGHFSKDVILTYTKIGGDCRDERRSYKVVENVIHRRPYLPPYDLWVTI